MLAWCISVNPCQEDLAVFDFGQVDLGTLCLDATERGIKEGVRPLLGPASSRTSSSDIP